MDNYMIINDTWYRSISDRWWRHGCDVCVLCVGITTAVVVFFFVCTCVCLCLTVWCVHMTPVLSEPCTSV